MKIIDVIKYEGDNRTFVWKYPGEDFNTMSQLIVHETQVAVLYKGGQSLDEFPPGEHRLHTKNIPLLNKIINLPSDGVSPFHCVVYFVNKTEQMNIKWGFGDVIYMDPNQEDYPFKIGARGSLSLVISDAKKLLNKLVGTENILTQEVMIEYFESAITMHIKDLLPKFLNEKQASIFEIETFLPEVSELLKERVSEEMADYGVTLVKLWTEAVTKPESDPVFQRIARIRGDKATIDSQGMLDLKKADYERREKEIRDTADINVEKYRQEKLGYTYREGRAYDVMEDMAKNEGTGSDVRNAFMGLGVGMGTAGVMGQAFSNVAETTFGDSLFDNDSSSNNGQSSEDEIPGMVNLSDEEGENDNQQKNIDDSIISSLEADTESKEEGDNLELRLDKLKKLYDKGLISEEEYEQKKSEILNSI